MISVVNVHKRFWTRERSAHWVLRGVTLEFPSDRKVALIGVNGAGKSTLLRLIAGIDHPTRGQVRCQARVSWPIGLTRGLQRLLTGRQNARFICRIHGVEAEAEERIAFVHQFSELGEAFDEPVWTYSNGMRARLNFSLSLAFRFDMYLVDEVMAVGDAGFKSKARKAMRNLTEGKGLIIASHSDGLVRSLCDAAVWLDEGHATWFDSVDEALERYHAKVGHG